MDKHFNTLDKQLDHQDWKPVIVRTNKSKEEDNLKHKKVPPEIRKLIQQKRGELKWTQKQLAQRCNFQVTIINDIETGKANYNPQHITKIKRILKL